LTPLENTMKIQILGTGCAKCAALAERAEKAAKDIGMDFEMEKVTNLNDIMAFGVMITPALAIDGKVKLVGKAPSVEELKELFANV